MKKFALPLAMLMLLSVAFTGCGGGNAASSSPAPAEAAESSEEAVETSGGSATEGEEMVLKISTDVTEKSVTGQALALFAETLKNNTNGRMTADIYYSGSLGTYTSVYEMIQEGDIAMWTTNPLAYETQVVELATLDQYYMFDDLAHAHRFLEGEGGDFLNKAWRKVNMEGMCAYALGFRQLTNSKKEIASMADLKGLTLRSYSTIQADAWSSVGAVPTSVDWAELFVSMQQKLIDGQEGGIPTINDFSFFEVQKYLTLTNHVFSMDMLMASAAWLDTLSDADEQIVRDAVKVSYEFHKEAYQAQLNDLVAAFETDYGMKVTVPSDEFKGEMKALMVPATSKGIIELCGQETYDKVQGYVEAARQS